MAAAALGGSGGKGGGSTSNTTTSTSQPPQQVLDAYGALINRATQQSLTPYQSYGGQQVAGLTPMQEQGFQNINSAQGTAQPYIDQASTYANQSAQPTWQDIPKYNDANLSAYQNPYQQNVIDTTMANINQNNAIQQQQLMGHAISSGASPFGGDRAGVAAAELARQQGLASNQTIAGLQNQGFVNAQQQFNNQQQLQMAGQNSDAQRQAQAATIQGGLGLASQGAALQGAQAQVQGGTLQQAQNQNELNVPYQNWLQQQAYPYQQIGWLGNLTEGLGSNMGGQSISSAPGASNSSQMLGLGMLGAGALGGMMGYKDGGAPRYAKGGNVNVYDPSEVITWIPDTNLAVGHTMPNSPNISEQKSGGIGNLASLMSMGSGIGKMMGGSGAGGSGGTDLGTSMPWLNGTGAAYSGNGVDMGSSMPWLESGSAMAYNSGGVVPHYANGGVSIMPIDNPHPVFNGISSSAPSNSNRDAQGNIISWVPIYPNESQTGAPTAGTAGEKAEKNPWMGAASGAMSGASMGSMFGPYGMAAGAIIGGGLGYFTSKSDGGPVSYADGGLIPYDDSDLTEEADDAPNESYQMAMENIPSMGATQKNAIASSAPVSSAMIAPGEEDITPMNNPGLAIASENPQIQTQKPSYSQALMMAGLGTLSSNSPNTLQNLAHGGLYGLSNYESQKKAILASQKERALEQHQQNLDAKPQIVTSGSSIQMLYPQEKDPKTGKKGLLIDTGIPTNSYALQKARIPLIEAQTEYWKNKRQDGKFSMISGTGQDESGNQVQGSYVFDAKTGESTFKPGVVTSKNPSIAATAASLPRDENGVIDESKVPSEVNKLADAMVEGRAPYPSGMMLKQPLYQQALALAQEKDPKYDHTSAPSRLATRKDFTAGKSAQNITALNTAIGHLATLKDSVKELNNSDYPMWNKLANSTSVHTGDTKVQGAMKDVETSATAVAGELAKVFRSTGMSTGEIQEWKNELSTSNSPAQFEHVITNGIELMKSRLDALGQQYDQGMGVSSNPLELLSPKAKKTLEKLEGNTKEEPKNSLEGKTATNKTTGAKMIMRNGQWQPL